MVTIGDGAMSDLLEGLFGEVSGDYLGDVDSALNGLDGLGDAGAVGLDIMDLVKNPAKLKSAIRGATQARGRAAAAARKHKKAGNRGGHAVASAMALQHSANVASLSTVAAMHATEKARRHMRANYAFCVTLSAAGGGTPAVPIATDTASIMSPVGDQPWHVVSWQTDLTLAQYFSLLQFVPASTDIVQYGNQGVSYLATAPAAQIPLYMWVLQSFGAPTAPHWQLAPWQAPGYGFGPAAVVKMKLGNIDAAAHGINILGLGRCSPCKRKKFGAADDGFHRLNQDFYSGTHPMSWY